MFLGLDLGTSELKALLLNAQHAVVATAHAPLTVQQPKPLWSEQAPQAWWHALETVMDTLHATHPEALAQLQGIGLSGQMHGAVLLDAQHTVLRPAILWNDGRSQAQCEALTARMPTLSDIAGNLAMPGFTAPKLLWVKAHEPDIFQQVRLVLLPKDWLRLKLCGDAVSEMSDAAGTLWLDVAKRDWSDALLAACDLNRGHMPRLVEGSAPSGHLLPALAQRWGIPAGVVIAGGAGDNAASAIGMGVGVSASGEGFVSLGTSGVVFTASDRYTPNPTKAVHAFCHALPDRWHQMSVMLSAASALSWAKRALNLESEAALLALAASLPTADRATAPIFLPYLTGERSPHNNASAQASWFGMSASNDAASLAYAVAEGVGFGLLDGLQTLSLENASGLSVVGGGSRSDWWLQLLADIFQLDLHLHSGAQTGAALGAARLGWLATGPQTPERFKAICVRPPIEKTFRPTPGNTQAHALLLKRHQRFQALYRATAPLMGFM